MTGEFNLDNAGVAFGLVIAAGLSTTLGAATVFCHRLVRFASKEILAIGLGFAAGVMLYVSFIDIFWKALDAFMADGKKESDAYFYTTLCLFAGIALFRVVHVMVHKFDPKLKEFEAGALHMLKHDESVVAAGPTADDAAAQPAADEAATGQAAEQWKAKQSAAQAAELEKVGLCTAMALAIQNFPEGLATFIAYLADPTVGVALAIAIGVHNIPEGLCVAFPIYYATQSRWKGFLWAFFSGLTEPIGALIGWLIIKSTGDDMNQLVYGILFGLVAGMMIMICILEILPTAFSYDLSDKYVTHSVVFGMVVIATSLVLLQF